MDVKEPFKYNIDYYGKSKNWLWKHQFQKNQKLYKSFEKIDWKNWGYAIIEK
jgi:hypothetical protein